MHHQLVLACITNILILCPCAGNTTSDHCNACASGREPAQQTSQQSPPPRRKSAKPARAVWRPWSGGPDNLPAPAAKPAYLQAGSLGSYATDLPEGADRAVRMQPNQRSGFEAATEGDARDGPYQRCPTCTKLRPMCSFSTASASGSASTGSCHECEAKWQAALEQTPNYQQRKAVEVHPAGSARSSRGRALPVIEKVCPSCKIVKPASEYHRSNTRRDGLGCTCKACEKKRQTERNAAKRAARLVQQQQQAMDQAAHAPAPTARQATTRGGNRGRNAAGAAESGDNSSLLPVRYASQGAASEPPTSDAEMASDSAGQQEVQGQTHQLSAHETGPGHTAGPRMGDAGSAEVQRNVDGRGYVGAGREWESFR